MGKTAIAAVRANNSHTGERPIEKREEINLIVLSIGDGSGHSETHL
jgi:hypothetical protein